MQSWVCSPDLEREAGRAEFEHQLRGGFVLLRAAYRQFVEPHAGEGAFAGKRAEIRGYQAPIDCAALKCKPAIAGADHDIAQPQALDLPAGKRLQPSREAGCRRRSALPYQNERPFASRDVGAQALSLSLQLRETAARLLRSAGALG